MHSHSYPCRTTLPTRLGFQNDDDKFQSTESTFNFESPIAAHLNLGASDVCAGKMPNAMSPMLRLWKTTHPNLVQAFADSQNLPSCHFMPFKGTPPILTVTAPSSPVSYGGANSVTHLATASDTEDGPNCCTITWDSDIDGRIGLGNNVKFTYPTPGPRLLTVTAIDRDGRIAARSFPLEVKNNLPLLRIDAPTSSVSYGGVISDGVSHKVTILEVEDGQNCCTVVWKTDKDGQLGVGTNINFRYPSPGPRTVTVTATDHVGGSTTTSFSLMVKNDPPGVRIDAPTANATIFQNVPFVARASSFDLNSPLDVPCTRMKWTSSRAGDVGFPFTGCEKPISFKARGARTITVTGTDEFGATGAATRQIIVQAVPPKTPPIVTILNPRNGDLINPTPAITLQSAVNAGAGAVTYRWTVHFFGPELDIGSGATLSWIPGNDVPFHCGGNSAVLKLYATNANGTGTASVNITVFYPVC